jgi:hypothetical protein
LAPIKSNNLMDGGGGVPSSRAFMTLVLFRSRPFEARENTGYDHSHHGSAACTRIIRLVQVAPGEVDTGEWRAIRRGQETEVGDGLGVANIEVRKFACGCSKWEKWWEVVRNDRKLLCD